MWRKKKKKKKISYSFPFQKCMYFYILHYTIKIWKLQYKITNEKTFIKLFLTYFSAIWYDSGCIHVMSNGFGFKSVLAFLADLLLDEGAFLFFPVLVKVSLLAASCASFVLLWEVEAVVLDWLQILTKPTHCSYVLGPIPFTSINCSRFMKGPFLLR